MTSPAPISFGHPSFDQPGLLEQTQVVGEQVPFDLQHVGELGNSPVAQREAVDDHQALLVAERRVKSCSLSVAHVAQKLLVQ